MIKTQLINYLKTIDYNTIFTGSFYPLVYKKPLAIISSGSDHIEIFASEQDGITIGEAIGRLSTNEWQDDTEIILTLGDDSDKDVVSSMGGVEWLNDELFLDTESCPRQR